MAVKFALRPRINLERPAPRRRLPRMRIPKLALPIAAYWLAMAGVTHALLQSTAEAAVDNGTAVATIPRETELEDLPSDAPLPAVDQDPATTLPSVASNPPPGPHFEPAPVPPAVPESAPDLERAPEPIEKRRTPVVPQPPLSRREPPAPVVRNEPRPPERPAPPPPVEQPALERDEAFVAPAVRTPPRNELPAVSLPSCESVAASSNETMDLRAARGAPDLTREAFATVLENGAYLARCSIPASTALNVCAAVQNGKVVGVSVTSEPRNPAINACVRRAVAALRFPRNPRLDVTRTRFEAAR